MSTNKLQKTLFTLAPLSFVCGFAGAQIVTEVYSTSFAEFTAGTEFKKDFNISIGGNTFPTNFKVVDFGQWGITNSGNDFAGGVLQPNTGGSPSGGSVKMAGVFIDAATDFIGNGTYTVTFQMTGDTDPDSNAAARAFIFGGSGADLSGTVNDQLDLSLSAGGFGGYTGLTAEGNASAAQLGSIDFSAQSVQAGTQTISFDFTYSGEQVIAFAVGSFDNALQVDDLAISTTVPEPSTYAIIFGLSALAIVFTRRKLKNR